MTKKILLSGIVGGIVMFIWSSIIHVASPLGEAGIKAIPNEEAVLAAMRDNIKESSAYLFPGFGESHNMTKEQQGEFNKKWEHGPAGFLVYHPNGLPAMSPKLLLTELLADILTTLIAAFLLSHALSGLTSLGSRVLFVGLLGLIPFFAISLSYWNWYGFPTSLTLADLIDQVGGFVSAGLVLAAIIKR